METLRQDIESLSRGAEFVRADLHIHSFGERGSYDVNDTGMTPEAIVEAAAKEGLSIISITDHNEIRNFERACTAAEGRGMLVVPGVELSTPQGHLLAYAPTLKQLERFYGKLNISDDRKTCSQTMEQCLSLIGSLGGFGIAAHIDLSTGLDGMHPRFDLFKEAVLTHEHLLGLEISNVSAAHWYSDRDDNPDRRRLHSLRAKKQGDDDAYELPRIMGSDAHGLAALGKNVVPASSLGLRLMSLPLMRSKLPFLIRPPECELKTLFQRRFRTSSGYVWAADSLTGRPSGLAGISLVSSVAAAQANQR
jgi:hypothetical protein